MDLEVGYLNEVAEKNLRRLCSESDRDYLEQINRVCDKIEACEGERKVLLLAGPSGSGKTTSAAMIEKTLRKRGHEAWDISLDDFYRCKTDPEYPTDEKGNPDMESVYALRTDRLRDCIQSLLAGQETVIPRYLFACGGHIIEDGEHITVPKGGIVVIEGLHALNPVITEGLSEKGIFKVFLSVSTNITKDGQRIISGRKLRFIRRMVRDYYYRKVNADRTYMLWESVLHGEDKYLYPHRHRADVAINTFHPCELSVMRPFAVKVLETMICDNEYTNTVRDALEEFYGVSEKDAYGAVSESSLLREFLPPEL